MGTFRLNLEIGDPSGSRYREVSALVDTGASHTVMPSSLLQELGVESHTSGLFVLADGREVEREIGRTWIRIDGREEITFVVFGGEDVQPLLGAYTLEGLRLGIDPVARKLVPVRGLMMAIAGVVRHTSNITP